MSSTDSKFEDYFAHLQQISRVGRWYKRYWTSPLLYRSARQFGGAVAEVGSGTGSGVLGAFPDHVKGFEINPHAVAYCVGKGLDAKLIGADGLLSAADGAFNACVLDNVLEHIEDPRATLDECLRVTTQGGGLIVSVPGVRGFASDDDHKVFYSEEELRKLHPGWRLVRMYATPLLFRSRILSNRMRQYCLVAVYKKKDG
jgi:SAM-dependent methyltransferase